MRRLLLLLLCGLYVVLLISCQGASRSKSGFGVSIDDGREFPEFLAGTWKAKDSPWKIVLTADGAVSSAVIPTFEVEVKPNQTTKVKMKDGQFSTLKAGDFEVEYIPAARELFVSIEIDDIHIVYLDNVIDGNTTDYFVGPVSEDGKIWTVDWINVFDYGPRLPQDANDICAEPLIFEKNGD